MKEYEYYSKIVRSKRRQLKRRPCQVCNKYKDITEKHHILKVKEQVELMKEFGIDKEFIDDDVIFLCPNHHKYLHKIIDYNKCDKKWDKGVIEVSNSITEDEWLKLREIINKYY